MADRFDLIMLITAPADVRRRRLTAKLTDSEFERRLAQQMPEEEKIARSRLRVPQHGHAQGAAGLRGPDRGEHHRRRATRRGGRRRRERPVRRLLLVVLLVAALGAVIGVARLATPLFGASGAPSWYAQGRLPARARGAIRASARRNGLDPALVAAVIYAESRFDEQARSSQGAVGLMQVLPETAAQIARESGGSAFTTADLEDPRSTSATAATTCAAPSKRSAATRSPPSPRTTPAWAPWRSGGPRRRPRGTSCGSATSRTRRRGRTSGRSFGRGGYTVRCTATVCARRPSPGEPPGATRAAAGPSSLANMCSCW